MTEENLKWEFKMEDFPKAAAEQVLLEDTGEPEAILSGRQNVQGDFFMGPLLHPGI